MSLAKVNQITGTALYVPGSDIDTDRIIPARFMKCVTFDGLGAYLFHDARVDENGAKKGHPLDDPRFAGASILLSNANFGCGSSREHAVWALADYGFRAVLAPSFADIFANNCVKNGVLTVALTEEEAAEIARKAELSGYQLTIDLESCTVEDQDGFQAKFKIDEFTRHCLLEGLDDIGLTLQHESAISRFESKHPTPSAWKT